MILRGYRGDERTKNGAWPGVAGTPSEALLTELVKPIQESILDEASKDAVALGEWLINCGHGGRDIMGRFAWLYETRRDTPLPNLLTDAARDIAAQIEAARALPVDDDGWNKPLLEATHKVYDFLYSVWIHAFPLTELGVYESSQIPVDYPRCECFVRLMEGAWYPWMRTGQQAQWRSFDGNPLGPGGFNR